METILGSELAGFPPTRLLEAYSSARGRARLKHITTEHPVSSQADVCTVDGCTLEFNTKGARTRHMETAHGIGAARPFSCPHAGCTNGPFKTRGTLNQHLKLKHAH